MLLGYSVRCHWLQERGALMSGQGIRLHEFVQHVREELLLIRKGQLDRINPMLQLGRMELEVQVKLAADAKAGVKFWIVNAGIGAKGEQTHKIKMVFEQITDMAPSSTPAAGNVNASRKERGGDVGGGLGGTMSDRIAIPGPPGHFGAPPA